MAISHSFSNVLQTPNGPITDARHHYGFVAGSVFTLSVATSSAYFRCSRKTSHFVRGKKTCIL